MTSRPVGQEGHCFLVVYADDVTFVLCNVRSVKQMIGTFKEYEWATGLCLTMHKPNGLIVKKNSSIPTDLSFINWNYHRIYVLNIPFGNCVIVKQLFREKNDVIQQEATRLSKVRLTYDAKTMIVKMKFMPKLMFLSKVYCFPLCLSAKLNSIISKFFLGSDASVSVTEISKNRSEGGYGVLDIPLYPNVYWISHFCKTD